MVNYNLLSTIWMFLIPLAAVVIPIMLGQWVGSSIKKTSIQISEGSIGSAIAASLGLTAFMLGFAFQVVGDRFERRKELMMDEISAMRTSYKYAGLIPEPLRSKARENILTYLDIRLQVLTNAAKAREVKASSEKLLDSLWSYCETLSAQDRSSESYSLFISSVSSLMNLFYERITVAFHLRLPSGVLYILTIVVFISMFSLGYQFGLSGRLGLPLILLLASTFAAVMWLVIALDRPEAGIIRVNDTPLINLRNELGGGR